MSDSNWRQLTALWQTDTTWCCQRAEEKKKIEPLCLYTCEDYGNDEEFSTAPVSFLSSSHFPRTVTTLKHQKRGKLGMSTPFYGTFKKKTKHWVSIWGGLFEEETSTIYRFVVFYSISRLRLYFLFLLYFKSCICATLFEHHNHEEFTACNCFSVIVANMMDTEQTNDKSLHTKSLPESLKYHLCLACPWAAFDHNLASSIIHMRTRTWPATDLTYSSATGGLCATNVTCDNENLLLWWVKKHISTQISCVTSAYIRHSCLSINQNVYALIHGSSLDKMPVNAYVGKRL